MTDSKTLLPCPICGGQPEFQHFNISPNVRGRIICSCGLELRQGKNDTEDDMRIIWNTRETERRLKQVISADKDEYDTMRLDYERLLYERDERIRELEQAIAATLGSGECEMEYGGDVTEDTKRVLGVYFCSECGSPNYNDCMPYFCIYCGKAVKR